SWLAARGRCRHCGHALGWFYPGIELAAIAVPLSAATVDQGAAIWLDCLLGWWLLALGWIDIRRWLLPDALTLPLIIVGLLATAFRPLSGAGAVACMAIRCVRYLTPRRFGLIRSPPFANKGLLFDCDAQ